MKVLLHPGFHKTGTTTLQRTLAENRAVLGDRLSVLLPEDLDEVAAAARRQSLAPSPRLLARVRKRLAERLREISDARPLLITCEHLAGAIPGRKGLWSYGETPALAVALVEAVTQRFVAETQVTVFFTTRAPEPWMRSVYWQNLRSNRITESFEDYADALGSAADLDAVVAATRAALGTRAETLSVDIDTASDGLGPLAVALDSLGVSPDGLVPAKSQNVRPADGIETLLALNRSDLDDDALSREKRRYLDRIRREKHRG
ncbi:hypothetical protein [Litorisediminicola beolgyonensis]|uniref:Sulfotransferase family protein n=1 Tax=Litorisediminicola beolgyonensis TaxID=1173614 RepID=A0ABW3ZGI4_9RHOB